MILPNALGTLACEDELETSPQPDFTHPRNLEHGFDGSRGNLDE